MGAIRETAIGIGLFTVPVKVFTATGETGIKPFSLCACEEKPKMRIECPGCGAHYPAWNGKNAPPKRGYKYGNEVLVWTKEEVLDAKAETVYDTITVEAVVPFHKVGIRYLLGGAYYLLPPEDTNETALTAYRTIVEVLDEEGWAFLTRLSLRSKPQRFAVISDRGENVLMAYVLQDRKPLPYTPRSIGVTDAHKAQALSLLQPSFDEEAVLEADPDPLVALIEAKVRERMPAEAEAAWGVAG